MYQKTTTVLLPHSERGKIMKNKQNISWKTIAIETTSDDDVLLKGELRYWAKDYTVCLKEPFESQGGGGHLMYAIPAIYIAIEAPRKDIVDINILERAKNRLLYLYKQGDVKPKEIEIDEKYSEALEEMRREKRELKSQLKSHHIDNREYQRRLTPIQKAKFDLEFKIRQLKERKDENNDSIEQKI